MRGLGSVANGSDAIGGTINVVTDAPVLGAGGRPSAQVQLRGGSADLSGVASGRVAWSGQRAGVVAIGSARHFGDLRAGGGLVQPFTAYDEWAAMTSGAWAPGGAQPGRRVSFSFQTDRQYDVPVRTDRSRETSGCLPGRPASSPSCVSTRRLPQGMFKRLRDDAVLESTGRTAGSLPHRSRPADARRGNRRHARRSDRDGRQRLDAVRHAADGRRRTSTGTASPPTPARGRSPRACSRRSRWPSAIQAASAMPPARCS